MDYSLIVKPNRPGLSSAVLDADGQLVAAFVHEPDALAYIAGKIAMEHAA